MFGLSFLFFGVGEEDRGGDLKGDGRLAIRYKWLCEDVVGV